MTFELKASKIIYKYLDVVGLTVMDIKSKDLAKILGVSTATISLILNNKPGISDDTRRNIIERITELGYGDMVKDNPVVEKSPNGNIINSYPRNIGFVIYKHGGELMEQTPFLPLMIDGLEAAARRNGYNLVIINLSSQQAPDIQTQYIRDSRCLGYVIFATEMIGDEVVPFERLGLPFVLLDNYYLNRKINCIKLNNEQGTAALVNHLIAMGHQTIGYLDSGIEIPSFLERKQYCFSALSRYSILDMEEYSYSIGYPEHCAYEGMKLLLKNNSKLPTAFLTDNDMIAFGATKAMKEHGIRVPDDISIVGFDDRPICTMMEPNLTTVRIPRASFGAEAVELLSKLLKNIEYEKNLCLKIEIAVELIVRDSVKIIQ